MWLDHLRQSGIPVDDAELEQLCSLVLWDNLWSIGTAVQRCMKAGDCVFAALMIIAYDLAVIDAHPICILKDIPAEQHQWRRDAPEYVASQLLEPLKCRNISRNIHQVVPVFVDSERDFLAFLAKWVSMVAGTRKLWAFQVGLREDQTSLVLSARKHTPKTEYTLYYLNFNLPPSTAQSLCLVSS
jgi:hypothetical protein